MNSDPFHKEQETIARAESLLTGGFGSKTDFRNEYEQLLANFKALLKDSRRTVESNNRNEEKLKEANNQINAFQEKLAQAHSELMVHTEILEKKIREPDSEQSPARELENSHRELQEAYVAIEDSHGNLEKRLSGSKWTYRIACILFLVIGGALFTWWELSKHHSFNIALFSKKSQEDTAISSTPPAGKYKTIIAKTQEVTDWLRLKGNIQPVKWIETASPLNAIVKEINFQYGDIVHKGQLLAILDTSDYNIQLRNANSQYIRALDVAGKLKNWSNGTEVLRSQRDLSQAEDKLKTGQRNLAESERLFKKGVIARSELESTQASVKDLELSVVSAKEDLQSTLSQGGSHPLKIANLSLENARQKLQDVKNIIAQATINSPTNGIIFPDTKGTTPKSGKVKKIHLGSQVTKGSPLFAIADMHEIAIDAQVTETEVMKLKHRQAVKAIIDALPGIILDGEIDYISGRASVIGSDSRESQFNVNVVIPKITDEQRKLLRIGMSAVAKVKIYDNPEAVVIPFAAITVEDKERYVQISTKEGIKRRSVEVRSTQVDGVEISDGVKPGDKLLIEQDESDEQDS